MSSHDEAGRHTTSSMIRRGAQKKGGNERLAQGYRPRCYPHAGHLLLHCTELD